MAAINGGIGGFLLGKFARLSSHYDYVQSLDNPAGFKQAMENVQRRTGTRVPEGFIIERIFEPSQTDNPYETQIPENGIYITFIHESFHSHPNPQNLV